MTVQDYLEELYEASGNEKKLCPGAYPYTPGSSAFDISAAGSVRMLRWLNQGYRVISKMKMPDGTPVRFPAVEADMFFKTAIVTGTVSSATASTVTVDAGGAADRYNGWLISIETGTGAGQVRMITDYDGSAATVHRDWDTTPDSTSTYKLYKRFMRFANPADADVAENIACPTANAIVNILKITDIEQNYDLSFGGRTQGFPATIVSAGRPTSYTRYGKGVFFDYAPTTEIWYRLEYETELGPLVDAGDEPNLPEQWQHLLWLWLVWKARTWAFEPNAAYGAKKDFVDFLRMTQLPEEMEHARTEGQVLPDEGY